MTLGFILGVIGLAYATAWWVLIFLPLSGAVSITISVGIHYFFGGWSNTPASGPFRKSYRRIR